MKPKCPKCGSENNFMGGFLWKNGTRRYWCQECGWVFETKEEMKDAENKNRRRGGKSMTEPYKTIYDILALWLKGMFWFLLGVLLLLIVLYKAGVIK